MSDAFFQDKVESIKERASRNPNDDYIEFDSVTWKDKCNFTTRKSVVAYKDLQCHINPDVNDENSRWYTVTRVYDLDDNKQLFMAMKAVKLLRSAIFMRFPEYVSLLEQYHKQYYIEG